MDAPNTEGNRSPHDVAEFKKRRRRERWSAFLTPLITLAAIVFSISFLMFILKTCEQRMPHKALAQPRGGHAPAGLFPASR
jgi:hypothetical protein